MNIIDPIINPPAFARPFSEGGTKPQVGMSLRDYYAAHALHALASVPGAAPDVTAIRAFAFADAMLAHRYDDLFPRNTEQYATPVSDPPPFPNPTIVQ